MGEQLTRVLDPSHRAALERRPQPSQEVETEKQLPPLLQFPPP